MTARAQNTAVLGSLCAVFAFGVTAVLLATNQGVGVPSGSLLILQGARDHQIDRAAAAYSAILNLFTNSKRDAVSVGRILDVVWMIGSLFAASWMVIRAKPLHPWRSILAGVLLVVVPPVLHAFTVLRPEGMTIFFSLAALACAEEFGRTRQWGWVAPVLLFSGVCASCGPAAGAIVFAVIVGIIGRRKGLIGFGHLWFGAFYAAVVVLIAPGPHAPLNFAPAVAALLVFFATISAAMPAIVAVVSLFVTVPWIIRAQRDGHDYSSLEWKHSKLIGAISHFSPGTVFYSNAPEAVARYDHHVVRPIPTTDEHEPWAELINTIENRDCYVIWFKAIGGDVSAINAHVSIEAYEELSDGTLYRADAVAWRGGARRPPFNQNTPSIPARRAAGLSSLWNDRHASYVAQAVKGNIDLLFLGDSITDDYRSIPGAWDFFQQRYGPYHPANFGIDGDRTQHLLFRILNGECDHLSPKVAVILIGTNNTADDSAEAIADGIKACVTATRRKLPNTRVLLLALFPRGGSAAHNDKREVILKVNALIAPLDNGNSVRFLNLYPVFLQPDGTLSKEIMYDGLHPSLLGYHKWADAMQPLLDEMMRAPPLARPATAPVN